MNKFLTCQLITVLPIFMQGESIISKNIMYNLAMPAGRPSKFKRTEFGKRIYEARLKSGLTQKHLAEKLKVTQPTYADWERRAVSIKPKYLAQLSELLGVSLEYLVGSDLNKKAQSKGGPVGKVRRVFEEVNELSRHQQQRILGVVEDMIAAQRTKT
jgi:transcriptional regulator with XRE-family HTH domain